MKIKMSANKYAYNYIKKRILNGDLKANEKINESKFAEEIEISRTPLREALRNLEADGLVEYITNKGVFVKDIRDASIEEVFDLRLMIETYVYLQAYRKITVNQINELKIIIKEMEDLLKRDNYLQINKLFKEYHRKVIDIAATSVAGSFLDNLDDYQNIIRNYNFNNDNKRLVDAIEEQKKITNLFAEDNIKLFEISVKNHILNAQHNFNK